MQKKIIFTILVLFLATLSFAQQVADSTQADLGIPADTTGAHVKVPADSTELQPLDIAPEDTVKIPRFDFRQQPSSYLRGLYRDSTFIIGSRYTTFGDVFDWFPGGYFANLGATGHEAFGSLFGAPVGEFALEYNGLMLNNTITGDADLNLVPTESIGNVGFVHSPSRSFGYLPLGASMHIRERDIADNPIRSQVAYRYGYYGSDDVDVRVGVRTSERLWLNFGGLIKNYNGPSLEYEYEGNKVNFSLNRRLGPYWLAKYVILFNQRDTNVPLLTAPTDLPEFVNPRQKDRRTDHSMQFYYKSNFKTILQFTKLEQNFHAQDRSVFDERHDAYTYRLTSEANGLLGFLKWRTGVTGAATWLNSNNWGKKNEWQALGYGSASGRVTSTLQWLANVRLQNHGDYSALLLPEANLFFTPDSTLRFSAWANRVAHFPSLQARYANGPFALGNSDLNAAVYDQIGVAGEKQFENLFIHGSAVFQQRKDQIAARYADEKLQYANLPMHNVVNINALFDYTFFKDWRFILKGDYFSVVQDDLVVANRPEFYFKSFLQYHLVKFKGDLNARLRAGAFVLGERQGPLPFYADVSTSYATLKPAIYPYFHAVLLYRSAEIFFAYENYIDADVQYVFGYSMPSMWLRYGVVWHFVD